MKRTCSFLRFVEMMSSSECDLNGWNPTRKRTSSFLPFVEMMSSSECDSKHQLSSLFHITFSRVYMKAAAFLELTDFYILHILY
jgi:hypothetical protein